MKKSTAIKLFGGRVKDLSKAIKVTPEAVSQWDENLNQRQTDQVVGAAIRSGVAVAELPIEYRRKINIVGLEKISP